MQTVIDSVCMNHLLRQPLGARESEQTIELTCLDRHIRAGVLTIVIDAEGKVISEWIDTCGDEDLKTVVSFWGELNGFIHVEDIPAINRDIGKKLRQLGFDGTFDKFLLRLAAASTEKNITSDDSDFWAPRQPRSRGDSSAVVCRCLREDLGVTVMLLGQLIGVLNR